MFWYQQEVVNPQNGYHIPHFIEISGNNQGVLVLPTLFNLIVENMVRNYLALTVEDQLVTQEGLGLAVGRCMGFLYTGDVVLGMQDLGWLQGALNVLIGLLCQYRLGKNV